MTDTFNATFFSANRYTLAQAVPGMLIVIPAHCSVQQSADMAYPFRQDSNFWYLTGLNEPDMLVVINTKTCMSYLLVPEQNDYQKEWDGVRDVAELKEISGVDEVLARSDLAKMVRDARARSLKIGYVEPLAERVEPYGFYSNPARRLLEKEIKKIEPKPVDVRIELARLRQIKQPVEISAIQQAIDCTEKSLKNVKTRLQDYTNEKEIERAITVEFFKNGSDGHAYEPIIASGRNASIIHYNNNNRAVEKDNLLLLDVGATVHGYAADISRTWVIGKPNDRHKAVYDAVVQLQQDAYSLLKTGVIIREYQKNMEEKAAQALRKLAIKPGVYPHGFSHFLGLDVHDAGDYEAPIPAGTVLTVEPGIYIPEEGIGVRIEDNVLVTETGIRILSEKIPQELI